MGRCRKCGQDAGSGRRICYPCMREWSARRAKIYDQVASEMGSMTATNSEAFKKRFRQLDRKGE